jgi:hypothetical protein
MAWGGLAFQRGIADGLTDAANAAALRTRAAFGLDAMQGAELTCTSEEDGLQDLFGGLLSSIGRPARRRSARRNQTPDRDTSRIGVDASSWALPFLPPLVLLFETNRRRRLIRQMAAAACWKRLCSSTWLRACCTNSRGMWKVCSFPSDNTDNKN